MNQEDKILKELLQYLKLLKEIGYYGLYRDQLLLIENYIKMRETTISSKSC